MLIILLSLNNDMTNLCDTVPASPIVQTLFAKSSSASGVIAAPQPSRGAAAAPQQPNGQDISPEQFSLLWDAVLQSEAAAGAGRRDTRGMGGGAGEAVLGEVEALRRQLAAVQQELASIKAEKAAWIRERDDLTREKAECNEQRDQIAQHRNSLAEANAKLVRDNAVLVSERDAAEQRSGSLAQQRDCLIQERDKLVQERDALAHAYAEFGRDKAAMVKERNVIAQQRDDLAQQKLGLLREKDALARSNAELATATSVATQERDCLIQERNDLVEERAALAQANAELMSDMAAALRQRDSFAREKADLVQQRDQAVDERRQLAQQLIDAEQRLLDLHGPKQLHQRVFALLRREDLEREAAACCQPRTATVLCDIGEDSPLRAFVAGRLNGTLEDMVLSRVQLVCNPPQAEETFCHWLYEASQQRATNPLLRPSNPTSAQFQAGLEALRARTEHLDGVSHCNMVLAWHAPPAANVLDVCRDRPRPLRTTDGGFFGAGSYFALESAYAMRYARMKPASADGEYAVILFAVFFSCAYVVTEADYARAVVKDPSRWGYSRFYHEDGLALKKYYDAHFIPVRDCGRTHPFSGEALPVDVDYQAADASAATAHELVVHSHMQAIPLAVAWFRPV